MENTYMENKYEEESDLINDWNVITDEELELEISEMNKSYERMKKREINARNIRSTPELISPRLLTPIHNPPTPSPKLSPFPTSSPPKLSPFPTSPLKLSPHLQLIINTPKSKIIIPEYINCNNLRKVNNLRKRENKYIEGDIIIKENIKSIKKINKFVKTNYLTKMSFVGLVIAVNFMIYYIYYDKNYRLLIKN